MGAICVLDCGNWIMSNEEYKFSYNINPEANEVEFIYICKKLEEGIPELRKEELLIDNDCYVDAVYINSNINLDGIINKKSVY